MFFREKAVATASGSPVSDPARLDEVERLLCFDVWETAVEDAVDEWGIEHVRFGPVDAFICGHAGARMMNFVLGAAQPGAVEHGHLDSAIEWMESHRVEFSVPVTPGLPDAGAAEDWLNRHGFERSLGLTRLLRDASPVEFPAPPGIDVEELLDGNLEGETLSYLVTEGFQIDSCLGTFFFELMERERCRCYIAIDEADEAMGCATMRIHDGVALLGLAATRPSFRGRGAHLALLRRRIFDAAAADCHTLFADAPGPLGGPPTVAHRNLLRAGFAEVATRTVWQPGSLAHDGSSAPRAPER